MLPSWTPNNELLYVGDQTEWWNLYHVNSNGDQVSMRATLHLYQFLIQSVDIKFFEFIADHYRTPFKQKLYQQYMFSNFIKNGRVVLNSGSVSTINKEMGDIIE
jgi:hypothetical protein